MLAVLIKVTLANLIKLLGTVIFPTYLSVSDVIIFKVIYL